eukprot:NODE_4206_length_699_cov_332.083851.p1 GENE.NODE_4206_length_699_cov_332.083851~~NODE_4206_length_699_cov_332.083851.p1  ORF type:complete len:218 (-),score=63.40 NODE_4206_length_699_cov_332.083851:28-681(-)
MGGNPEVQDVPVDNMTYDLFSSAATQVEYRFTEVRVPEKGSQQVHVREEYFRNLHTLCFNSVVNQGFDALADFHMECTLSPGSVDRFYDLYQRQIASGFPYRFYTDENNRMLWFYSYGPNGQGNEVTAQVPHVGEYSELWSRLEEWSKQGTLPAYNFCRQGISGVCSSDRNVTEGAEIAARLANLISQPGAKDKWPCFSGSHCADDEDNAACSLPSL